MFIWQFFFTTVKRYRQGSDCSFHSESSASPQSEVDVGEWIRALNCNVSIVCNSGTKAHEIGHFQVSKILTFKTRLSAKIFLVNEFYLNENEKSFSYQWLCTQPRFKTGAWGNSEMAFWHAPNVRGIIALNFNINIKLLALLVAMIVTCYWPCMVSISHFYYCPYVSCKQVTQVLTQEFTVQWNLNITKGRGPGKICLLYLGYFSYTIKFQK